MKLRVFETDVEPFSMIVVIGLAWTFFTVVALVCVAAVVLALGWWAFNLPARAFTWLGRRR